MSKSPAICIASDLHVNSLVGLWPPSFQLEDGGEYKPNRFQDWLWRNWLDSIKKIPKGVIVVLNGDIVEGIHANRDTSVVTASAKDMRRAAVAVLEPLAARASKLYVVRGTDYHGGVTEGDTETVAEALDAVKDKDTGQYSTWELWLEHEGKVFNFAHSISVAPVYPMTPMARVMMDAKISAVDCGWPMPDCIVRSHRHQHKQYPDGRRWVLVTPGWQLKTAYIWKKKPDSLPSIGSLVIRIERDEIRPDFVLYPLPKPVVHKVD